jgi:hypothetical protein
MRSYSIFKANGLPIRQATKIDSEDGGGGCGRPSGSYVNISNSGVKLTIDFLYVVERMSIGLKSSQTVHFSNCSMRSEPPGP